MVGVVGPKIKLNATRGIHLIGREPRGVVTMHVFIKNKFFYCTLICTYFNTRCFPLHHLLCPSLFVLALFNSSPGGTHIHDTCALVLVRFVQLRPQHSTTKHLSPFHLACTTICSTTTKHLLFHSHFIWLAQLFVPTTIPFVDGTFVSFLEYHRLNH